MSDEGSPDLPPPLGLRSFPRRPVAGVDPNELAATISHALYGGGQLAVNVADYIARRATADIFPLLEEELGLEQAMHASPPTDTEGGAR